jgi:hypothetical protein
MVDVSKFYKTEKIEINGEELEIRAYRVGDGPLVADILEAQFKLEELEGKLEKDERGVFIDTPEGLAERFRLRTKEEDLAGVLGQRGLKRALDPENRTLQVDELDLVEDIEMDPQHLLTIAWTMIRVGMPTSTPGAGKKKPRKRKSGIKKNSSTASE